MEIIKKLNDLKIRQQWLDWEEDISEEIHEEFFEHHNFSLVEDGLGVCKHRWYETSIKVYEDDKGNLIGVESVTDTFGEQQMVEDCYHTLEFFEMEAVSTITYIRK